MRKHKTKDLSDFSVIGVDIGKDVFYLVGLDSVVSRIEADPGHPIPDNPRILPCRQQWPIMQTTWNKVRTALHIGAAHPVPDWRRN